MTSVAAVGTLSYLGFTQAVSYIGFTKAGIAAGSWAAAWMSSTAVASGGGVAAGSAVATMQAAAATGSIVGPIGIAVSATSTALYVGIKYYLTDCPNCNTSPIQCSDKEDFSSFIHNYHAELIANSVEVECPNINDCDLKRIPRGDLKKHLDQFCTGRKCGCKMAKYGCEWFGLSSLMDGHSSHDCIFSNPIIAKAIQDLEVKVSSLTSENQKLKEENEKTLKRVKELESRGISPMQRNEPTAPTPTDINSNSMMANQFNSVMPVYSQISTPMTPQQPNTPLFNQQASPMMNQSMYGSSIQPMNQSMYTSYGNPYISTTLQSPTYGTVIQNSRRVRLVVTTCIWSRLPGVRGDVYLPLTDGYDNTFDFNVNEFNNGEITSSGSPTYIPSGNWTSGAIKLNLTWTQLNRTIIIDGMAGFCTPGATNLILNFAVKATGLAGRGNVGDGGKIHCTVIVS